MRSIDRPLHLYGVVRPGTRPPADAGPVEPSAGPVELVEHSGVAALVSAVAEPVIRATPHNLKAHQGIVEAAFGRGVVLPFRFGVVVDSRATLTERVLAPRAGAFRAGLDRFDGLVEARLTVRHQGDEALREVVARSPRVRRLNQRVSRKPAAASYFDRIALGEEVAAGLQHVRVEDGEAWSAHLRALALDDQVLAAGGSPGGAVLKAAYLLERAGLPDFEAAVEDLAAGRPGRFEVELLGPLAPWDFVELSAEQPETSGAAWAS